MVITRSQWGRRALCFIYFGRGVQHARGYKKDDEPLKISPLLLSFCIAKKYTCSLTHCQRWHFSIYMA